MRFCSMCGAPLAVPARRERRHVTVVFIDLAGFTTLTRGLDPEPLRDLADEVLTAVAAVIEEFAGHVDSFRGDGLIAVFGAPRAHADDAERAVNAAAAGLRAIERIGTAAGTGLKGRAGVSTGTVIAGELGSGRVREYTVMGSTVNLAARVEAAATPGEVWVSPATKAATRTRFSYESSGPVTLTGFPDVEELFILRSDPAPVAADPFAEVSFVGRTKELEALKHAHRQVGEDGRALELWVSGSPGIGKSRLLREFVTSHLPEDTRVLWPVERSGASLSWQALARTVFTEPAQVGSLPQQSQVEAFLEELLPDELRWHRQVLGSLGFEELGQWMRPERRRVNRTSLAWRDLLAALARSGESPLVLVLDLAVQDPELTEFLQLLREAAAPILILRSTRLAERPESEQLLRVEPLGVEDSLQLLNEVADPVMQPATEALVYQVGGVPSYILELGRTLTVTDDSSFSDSLEAVLQARLDSLPAGERTVLALAALTGERSWESLLLELGGRGTAAALERLTGDNSLLKQPESRIPGEVELRFQSELLRHAVLKMVPYSDRRKQHLRIGAWLESRAPLDLSELIGRHFSLGGSDDAAWPHYLTALEHSLRVSADAAAISSLIGRINELRLPALQRLEVALAALSAAVATAEPQLARQQLETAWALSSELPETPEYVREKLAELATQVSALQKAVERTAGARQAP